MQLVKYAVPEVWGSGEGRLLRQQLG